MQADCPIEMKQAVRFFTADFFFGFFIVTCRLNQVYAGTTTKPVEY
jgi:hypothetical protein